MTIALGFASLSEHAEAAGKGFDAPASIQVEEEFGVTQRSTMAWRC